MDATAADCSVLAPVLVRIGKLRAYLRAAEARDYPKFSTRWPHSTISRIVPGRRKIPMHTEGMSVMAGKYRYQFCRASGSNVHARLRHLLKVTGEPKLG